MLTASSTLFTQRVLVTPFLPDPNIFPWLGWEEILECARRKYFRFVRLAITILQSCHPCEQPHSDKWDRCSKGITRLGNEAATSCLQNAVHFRDNTLLFGQDGKEPRSNNDIEFSISARKLERINPFKAAIAQTKDVGTLSGPLQLTLRTINACDRNIAETFRELARVKTRPATKLNQLRTRIWRRVRPESCNDSLGIISEEMLAAEHVYPSDMFKETIVVVLPSL